MRYLIVVISAFLLCSEWGSAQVQHAPLSLVIGRAPGVENEFSWIAGLGSDLNGNVFVADQQGRDVRMFDRQGKFVRRFGRQGQGPGEMESISGIAVSGKLLYVVDNRLRRIVVFDILAGTNVTAIPITSIHVSGAWGGGGPIASDDRITISQMAANGALVRATYGPTGLLSKSEPIQPSSVEVYTFSSSDGAAKKVAVPFTPRGTWAVSAIGDFFFADGKDYAIDRIAPEGVITQLVRRTSPVPIGDPERRAATHWLRAMVAAFGGDSAQAPKLPGSGSAIYGLNAATDSKTVWVLRTEWASNPLFDVWDLTTGRYKCAIALDSAPYMAHMPQSPMIVTPTRVIHVGIDANDVQHVLVNDLSRTCNVRA